VTRGSGGSGREGAGAEGRPGTTRVPVREEADVAIARTRARDLARREGFPEGRVGALATAVTEVARNIIVHAGTGDVLLAVVEERGRRGILVVARDAAHGIPDVELAMRDGYSTRGGGLGLGLPSARRLMDEFTLVSAVGEGTTVTMKKWAHERTD
jgi:serine/threonine-protein kinase RsbT